MSFFIRYFVSCLAVAAAMPVAARTDADEVVKKVRERYEQIKSLRVEFVQTIYWSLADEEQQVRGTLYLSGQDRYRVETDNQIIVTDGKTVWTYSKDRKQVVISLLGKSEDNPLPRDLLLQYTRNYRYTLRGEAEIDGKPCYEIEFTPRDEDAFVVRTRVWIDKNSWLALKIEQEDINENITRYELRAFQLNPPLDSKLFSFTITDEMEVVDMR